MGNLYNFLKKNKKIVISFFLVVVLIPVIIHVLFKINPSRDFFSAEWTAGDVLAYFGVLIGASATFGGVFLSIQYAQENYRKDTIYRSLPFMAIKGINKPINEMSEKDFEGVLYYVIKDGKVYLTDRLTADQHLSLSHCGKRMESTATGIRYIDRRLFVQKIEVENIGNGAAATFSIGVDKSNAIETSNNFSLPTSLKVGEVFRFVLFSENQDEANIGDYAVCVSYYDILGNAYEQRLKYCIFEDSTRILRTILKLDGTQVSISAK